MNTSGKSWTESWGLVPVRLVVGAVFLAHVYQKLFIFGPSGTVGFMTKVGIPLPAVAAVVVTVVEFLGGLALIVGLGARWMAALLTIDMLVAILIVRLKAGFLNGYEFELTLLGASLSLALLGSGPVSMDKVLSHRAADTAG